MKWQDKLKWIRDYRRTLNQKEEAKNILSKLEVKNLSKKQQYEIKSFYKENLGLKMSDMLWHKMYYSINDDFDVRYIPINIVFQKMIQYYNNELLMLAYSDKNRYDILFKDFDQPKTILKKMGGEFYVNNLVVSKTKALNILENIDDVILKPSLYSGQGRGVICLKQVELHSLKDFLDSIHGDYIIQERVKQHPQIACLNNSSLNTFRVITLRRGSDVLVLSVVIKIGKNGEIVDNGHSGGYFVGVNSSGLLKKWVYSLSPYSKNVVTESGFRVEGYAIPFYDKLVNAAKQLALLLPYHKMVGWDLAIDEQGKILLIELNINSFGLNIIQMPNGPLLGEYTVDVLRELKSNSL